MKGELKAGGLALCYGLSQNHTSKWNGRTVTLIERCDNMADEYSEIWWRCETRAGIRYFAPKNLLPIDGDPDQEPEQLAKDKPREVVA